MSTPGVSRANANKKIRQDALREQLANGKHVEHVIDIANKLASLDEDMDALTIQRLKAAADIKKGLIGKYLPDLKSMEIEADLNVRPRVVDLSSGKMSKDAEPDSTV